MRWSLPYWLPWRQPRSLLHTAGPPTLFSPLSTRICCWPVSPAGWVTCQETGGQNLFADCLAPSPEQVRHGLSVSREVLGGPVGPRICQGPGVLIPTAAV